MRSPVAWLLFWIIASIIVLTVADQHVYVSAFWLGWSMAIFGQDIADWIKKRGEF